MALPATIPLGISERVADAVGDVYGDRRHPVRIVGLTDLVHGLGISAGTLCLVCDDLQTIEIVLSLGADPQGLRSPIAVLDDEGWDIVVLVPAERLGETHRGLRGAACVLQPWWIEADDVHFGDCETP
jgi:hypothetical protein